MKWYFGKFLMAYMIKNFIKSVKDTISERNRLCLLMYANHIEYIKNICKVVEVIELQFVYVLRNQVILFKVLIFLFFWTFSPQLNPFYSGRTEDYRP